MNPARTLTCPHSFLLLPFASTSIPIEPAALLGIGEGDAKLDAAIVAGVVSIAALLLRAFGLLLTGQLERQRSLFSEAYRAAMGWREQLYRVRRRPNTQEAEYQLINEFHDLQEKIDFYEGWAASEGKSIGRSYCRLVRETKAETAALLQQAWAQPGRDPGLPAPDGEIHPDLSSVRERFLFDVRCQLSLFLLPRVLVYFRNCKS
ncbi:MAG TPA: hypothetical protein VLI94_00810 [Solirubrobacterales bacterium]|nr:hypothetical protein [Solirubrobacterales bacterium]